MKKARSTPREQADKIPELYGGNINLSKSDVTFTGGEPGLSG